MSESEKKLNKLINADYSAQHGEITLVLDESARDVLTSPALIQYKDNGDWYLKGVDWDTVSPNVYAALCKLKDLERALVPLNKPRK